MQASYAEKVYDLYSSVYDFVFGPTLELGRKTALPMLNPRPHERILEVGFGTGLSLPYFPRETSIVGIDVSEKMMEVGRRRIEKLGHKDVELRVMDATKLEFDDGSFDAVLALYVVSCVDDPVQMLREMKRVVRPGGRLVFMNHFQSERPWLATIEKVIAPVTKRIGFHTDLELMPLLKAAGMPDAEIRNADPLGLYRAVKVVV